jgi:hypothetical protein
MRTRTSRERGVAQHAGVAGGASGAGSAAFSWATACAVTARTKNRMKMEVLRGCVSTVKLNGCGPGRRNGRESSIDARQFTSLGESPKGGQGDEGLSVTCRTAMHSGKSTLPNSAGTLPKFGALCQIRGALCQNFGHSARSRCQHLSGWQSASLAISICLDGNCGRFLWADCQNANGSSREGGRTARTSVHFGKPLQAEHTLLGHV